MFSYPDTQRYRLGANYLQIPVNCPFAPVRNNQRDGFMQTKQQPSTINYEPNSYETEQQVAAAPHYQESAPVMHGHAGRQVIEKTNDFQQAGERYRSFSEQEKTNLIKNLAADLAEVNERTKLLAICNFYRADVEYGQRLAEALQVDLSAFVQRP